MLTLEVTARGAGGAIALFADHWTSCYLPHPVSDLRSGDGISDFA